MKSRRGAVACRSWRKAPFPLPASRTGQAGFPHPALPRNMTAQDMRRRGHRAGFALALALSFSRSWTTFGQRARLIISANRLPGLRRMRSKPFRLRLLRSIPFPGLPRYYEPLCDPRPVPCTYFGGWAVPCSTRLSFRTCRDLYPVGLPRPGCSCSGVGTWTFPLSRQSRRPNRYFRGLHGLHPAGLGRPAWLQPARLPTGPRLPSFSRCSSGRLSALPPSG